jgi:hypothetical protein
MKLFAKFVALWSWSMAKVILILGAWILSIVVTMASTTLLNSLSSLGSLVNLPSVHMKQKTEIDAQKRHAAKVKKMTTRNANRSQRRIANALKRLPADELVSLLGPIGFAAGGGFIAYDLADMCFEINDANELLELVGEPLVDNPISDNCDKIERGGSYIIQNVKKGWTVVVEKTSNGWRLVKAKTRDVMDVVGGTLYELKNRWWETKNNAPCTYTTAGPVCGYPYNPQSIIHMHNLINQGGK